jgi:hypothetical protein
MKTAIATIALALLMCCSAFAKDNPKQILSSEQVTTFAQRAANAVPALRASMKDPDSFVLEGVFIMFFKHDNGIPSFCYVYRAHNSYGGYSDSEVARLSIHGELTAFGKADDSFNMCAQDMWRRYLNITKEVKAALNPPAPVAPPVSPADAAKKAQQYADCLKAAVDNPSIVCK